MQTPPPPSSTAAPTSPTSSASRWPNWLHLSDLQGLAQLATQATLGITGLAETVQGRVYKSVAAPFGPLGQKFVDPSPASSGVKRGGITSLAYGSVRGVTRLVGGAADKLLAGAGSLQRHKKSSRTREAMLAAINGVLGDRLLETANPLTITMSFRHEGEPLLLDKAALAQRLPHATGKVLVLVHGLCMNDLQWTGSAVGDTPTGAGTLHDHGAYLARELGYTPVYLHYNTGLSIADNGQRLAGLMEQLWQAWPVPISTLTLLTHSMGGLVSRSACHHAEAAGQRWRQGLDHLIFLGTPHGGAPLEALGHWVDKMLGSNIVTRPFAAIGLVRSAGIQDLREGKVLPDVAPAADETGLPLPEGVQCCTVAATIQSEPASSATSLKEALANRYLGDGLVPVPSALGVHPDTRQSVSFRPEDQWRAWDTGHVALLHSSAVAAQLRRWLST